MYKVSLKPSFPLLLLLFILWSSQWRYHVYRWCCPMMLPSSYSSKSHKLRHKRRHHLLDTPLQTLDALLVLISKAPFLKIVEKKMMGFDWFTRKLKGKELYVGFVGWVVLILHIPFWLVLPFFPNCIWSLKRIVQYFN